MPKTKRRRTKWYYMSDTTGRVRLVGLLPTGRLTGISKTRKEVIRRKLKRK